MKALILIDIQRDYLRNGSLPIFDGESVVAVANELIGQFDLVVATQNCHPSDHKCFAANHQLSPNSFVNAFDTADILWPNHCVQGTSGAQLAAGLLVQHIDRIFYKRTAPSIHSFSGFATQPHQREEPMHTYLHKKKITTLYVLGLPTEYGVQFTVLDALEYGYEVFLVVDGCRGLNHRNVGSEEAIARMEKAGACVIASLDAVPQC